MPIPTELENLEVLDSLEGREEDPLAGEWTKYPAAANTGAVDNAGWHSKKEASGGNIAEQLASMSITDTMQHAAFPETWIQLPWASSRGSVSVSGWRPPGYSAGNPAESRGGWYLNSVLLGSGDAAVKMQRATEFGELNLRQFSLWLFMDKTTLEAEEGPIGYQLVAWQTGTEDTYTFKLRRWDGVGEETLLDEQTGVVFDVLGEFALVSFGGKISGWRKNNEEAAWELATEEVGDTTYEAGYSGVDGNGSNPTFKNFATDELEPEGEEETYAGAYHA